MPQGFPSMVLCAQTGTRWCITISWLSANCCGLCRWLNSNNNDDGFQLASAAVGQAAAGPNSQPQLCYPAGQIAVAVTGKGAIYLLSADSADNRTIPIAAGNDVNVADTDTEGYVDAGQAGAPVSGYDLATGELLWTVPVPKSLGSDAQVSAFDGGFLVGALARGDGSIAYQ